MTGSSKRSMEPLGSIKGGNFFDRVSDNQFLKKDSAPWI